MDFMKDFVEGFEAFKKQCDTDGDDGTAQIKKAALEDLNYVEEQYKKNCEHSAMLRLSTIFIPSKQAASDLKLRLDIADLDRDIEYNIDKLCFCTDVQYFTDEDRQKCEAVKEYLGMVLVGLKQFAETLEGGKDGD